MGWPYDRSPCKEVGAVAPAPTVADRYDRQNWYQRSNDDPPSPNASAYDVWVCPLTLSSNSSATSRRWSVSARPVFLAASSNITIQNGQANGYRLWLGSRKLFKPHNIHIALAQRSSQTLPPPPPQHIARSRLRSGASTSSSPGMLVSSVRGSS